MESGELTVKETMAITMINAHNVGQTEFENSHLLSKLQKAVIAARIWENQEETRSILHSAPTFDLLNHISMRIGYASREPFSHC